MLSACAAPGQVAHAPAESSATIAPLSSRAPTPSAMESSTSSTPAIIPIEETVAVPWIAQPGTMFEGSPLPVPTPPTSGPPCRAADLKVSDTGGNGGGGHYSVTFDFLNVSSAPCILQGFPHVVATEPGRRALVAGYGGFFVGTEQSATMQPGGTTSLNIETERDCDARYAALGRWPTLLYHTATVSIPGGGTVVLHEAFDVECGFYAGKFGVAQPQPEYTKSPISGATAQLELPSAVEAGSTLKYAVDLTNSTSSDMALNPCPGYQQGLGAAGKTILALNCAAMPALPTHATRRFAMELAVPADFPTGPTDIYWNVAAIFDNLTDDVAAHASIQVNGADTPCASNQLSAAITGPGVVPGPPNGYGEKGAATAVALRLTNRSTSSCSVRGTPEVTLTDFAGQNLDLTQADQRTIMITSTVVPALPSSSHLATPPPRSCIGTRIGAALIPSRSR